MRFPFLIIAIAISITFANAQEKLTLEDAVLKSRTTLRPKSLKNMIWIPETKSFTHIANNKLVKQTGNNVDTILSANDLGIKDLKSFPYISWNSSNEFQFSNDTSIYTYNVSTKTLEQQNSYTKAAHHIEKSGIPSTLAYVNNHNVFIAQGGKQTQITTDGKVGIEYGQAVHRYEFGISKGLFWSPNNNLLAFYRKDETMVTDYPLVHVTDRPASLEIIKYPMAGDSSHHVTIGVYNIKMKTTVYLKTEEPKDQYLTNVAWGPNENYIYVAVLNRDQNHVKFNKYDATTGALISTLFEEKDEEFIQPLKPMFWVNNDEFVWISQQNGFKQLYLYNASKGLVKQLTDQKWNFHSVEDKNASSLLVSGTGENGTERHLFSVDIKSGKITNLTKEPGSHYCVIHKNGSAIIDSYSALNTPRKIRVLDTSGNTKFTVLESKNPLENYNAKAPEIFTIKAADKTTDLYCRMIKPFDFDESKKYPALVYVYNGPGVQLITNSFGAGSPLWMQEFANRGYIVFTVDGRGSSNRGEAFEQATFRNLGDVEMDDQLAGVDYLKSLKYIDGNRLAVHGWSYGGFMTTSLMLRKPDVFKVGVAGGPVIDWKYYEIMYTERYMDTPQTNPEGFEKSSLLNHVTNLEGKLLMIHGAVDDVVVWQHSLDFVKKCVDEGVQIDYFMYPEHPHNVRGKDRLHLMTKVLDYIEDNL